MRNALIAAAVLVPLLGCVEMVSVNRQMVVPSLAPDCPLELVQADMMELSPMSTKWDYLGTVSVGANHGLDPSNEEYRALIRPKACELGGTAVALMQSGNSSAMGTTSGSLIYAVLRPKSAPAAPAKF